MITVEPGLFALAAGGASAVGILAALVPARRAARLDPVVAIRG
jgi:lipoprotein-releasing system permease protein